MSEYQKIIATVEDEKVGAIVRFLTGRVLTMEFEVVESLDGRSRKAKEAIQNGDAKRPVKDLPKSTPELTKLRNAIIRALRGGDMKTAEIHKLVGGTINNISNQLTTLRKCGYAQSLPKRFWRLTPDLDAPAAPEPVEPGPKRRGKNKAKAGDQWSLTAKANGKRQARPPVDGQAVRSKILKLLEKGPLNQRELAAKLALPVSVMGWQRIVLSKSRQIKKSGGKWYLAGMAKLPKFRARAIAKKAQSNGAIRKRSEMASGVPNELKARILGVLATGAPMHAAELGKTLSATKDAVRWHLKKFAAAGKVKMNPQTKAWEIVNANNSARA